MAPNAFKHNSNSTSDCSWIVVDSTPDSGEAVESGEFILYAGEAVGSGEFILYAGEAVGSGEFILDQHIQITQLQPDTSVEQSPIFSPLTCDYLNQFLFNSGFETSIDELFRNQKDSEAITSQQFNGGTPEERLRQALDKYKNVNSTKLHHVVAQLWVPIPTQGDFVLRHSGQYTFGPLVNNDEMKKKVSTRYVVDSLRKVFPIGLKSAQSLGVDDEDTPLLSNLDVGSILVNRWVSYKAFQLQNVQWAPNIHIYCSNSEHYCICATLAIPVFDCETSECIGVLELVIDCAYIDYVAEMQEICKTLQEVRLGADTKLVNQPRQMVLLEIMNLLRNVSRIHNLPLAQTWLPCKCCDGDKNSETMQICMCSAEIPFILMDSSLYQFWKDSSMYHMHEGQGVAGRAFMSKASCFCHDITQFSDTNFKLVHTSRKFGVCSSLAICLKSSNTGDEIYIVQFFIRNRLTSVKEQKHFVDSIVESMIENCESLKLASTEVEEIDPKLGNNIRKRKWVSNIRMVKEQNSLVSSSKTSEEMVDKGKGRMVELNGNKDGYKKVRKKKTNVSSLEDLKPFLYGTKEEAAIALGVSKSTIKRLPQRIGFENWSDAKKYLGLSPTKRRSKAHKCDEPSSSSSGI